MFVLVNPEKEQNLAQVSPEVLVSLQNHQIDFLASIPPFTDTVY